MKLNSFLIFIPLSTTHNLFFDPFYTLEIGTTIHDGLKIIQVWATQGHTS